MGIPSQISRVAEYYKRHGIRATLRRGSLAARRLFAIRMVVIYCDVAKRNASPVNLPSPLKIERITSYSDLTANDLQALTEFWNPRLARRNMAERFAKGTSLWLIKSGDELAGFSWTLRGCTIAEYYFPIGRDDVQLFDVYAFPKFRGMGTSWYLIMHILDTFREEGAVRVLVDIQEWNLPSLALYKMTPFRHLGMATSFNVFGHTFVFWGKSNAMRNVQKHVERTKRALRTAKSNE